MLTRTNRLRASRVFVETARRGRRAGTKTLVLHLSATAVEADGAGPQVGFVVSKAVGTAVTRNLVKRRLRHLSRERLDSLPGSGVLVVRALPAAASASYAELATDFDTALARVVASTSGSSARRQS